MGDLFDFVQNDAQLHSEVVHYVKMLRNVVDRAARKLAKANADWHDDPDDPAHAAYHAPAEEQFPKDARTQAVVDLVEYHARETS